MSFRIALLLLVAVLISACGREESQETPTPDASPSSEPAGAAPPATAPSQNQPPQPRAGFGPRRSAGTTIGVPECDDFLSKYEACMAKAPEEARPAMQTALSTWRGSWRTLATTPVTRETAAQNCRAAADSVRSQLESYGCTP